MGRWKNIVFVLLVTSLFVPGLQQAFHFAELKPLKGDFVPAPRPSFSWQGWLDGSFQSAFDKWLEQHIGFRPFLVRLNNQVVYSVFGEVTNKNLIKGKDGYLFERWYVNSYRGTNFIGTKKIADKVRKLQAIDSALQVRGVHLVVVLAPGKPDVMPDKLPSFMQQRVDTTNYAVYRELLLQSGVTLLDANNWFIRTRKDFPRNYFTKGGTHWSNDAALLALDSLLRLVENVTGEERNRIVVDSIVKSRTAKSPDNDLLEVANLLFPNQDSVFYYPAFHFTNNRPPKGKFLAIGDSFFWNIYNFGLRHVFEDVAYWYYFKDVYPESFDKPTTTDDINYGQEILESDVVLLIASTAQLPKVGFGFIDNTYDLLVGNPEMEIAVKSIILAIRSDEDWLNSVKRKAEERNIPLDSMIRMDAEYVYKMNLKKKKKRP